jgi:general secretion pathway protein I
MIALTALKSRARGFSLLEVLLALSMFALAFGLLMETIATAGRTVRVAGDVGHVALWAQNRLDQLGIAEPITVGSKTGSFDEVYSYTQTVSNYIPSDSPGIALSADELLRVELAVTWGRGEAARTERFTTLRVKTKEGRF